MKIISRWLSRPRIVVLLCLGAVISLAVMAQLGALGWDARQYWSTMQCVRHGCDPYGEDLIALRRFHERLARNPAEHQPYVYAYSPLTLPVLRLLAMLPGAVLVPLYGAAVATGALVQLWAGLQMAGKYERRWLIFMLPPVVFFPGLITDDVVLSGNAAYILYGAILAAATVGWKRDRWTWYYIAVLAASIFKTPFLAYLAFPVLVDRRQWARSSMTAAAGVLILAAQMRLWPGMFREYLLSLRMVFDWLQQDFGFGPAGILGRYLWKRRLPAAFPAAVFYLVFAGGFAIVLLWLARRVSERNLPRQAWVPIALVGTALLNPRIMKYDLAAITVPMLLIAWRVLRYFWNQTGNLHEENLCGTAPWPSRRTLLLIGGGIFLIPNLITIAGPQWVPVELAVLLAIFVGGAWSAYLFHLNIDC